tara:strand:+ start:640 stop:753 length:114 start_codon:yes stop_codon:yes gene_type:complete
MEVAMWSTSDLITNLTFFDEPKEELRLQAANKLAATI